MSDHPLVGLGLSLWSLGVLALTGLAIRRWWRPAGPVTNGHGLWRSTAAAAAPDESWADGLPPAAESLTREGGRHREDSIGWYTVTADYLLPPGYRPSGM